MSDRTLKWNSETMFLATDPPDSIWEVSLIERVDIPPRSELCMMLPIGPGCLTGLFEMNDSLYQFSNVYAARSLVQPQLGEIPVRLVNPGLHVVTLEPNTKIGEVTSINYLMTTSLVKQDNSSVVNNISLPKDYLSVEQQVKLRNVLNKHTDVFAQSDSDLGRTNILEHAVDKQGHAPISQRPSRVPQTQCEIIETHIRDMANRGDIRSSRSPWSSPVVLVGKKDGSTRFCVDFRKINAVTRKDVYPLPRIDETLDTSLFDSVL